MINILIFTIFYGLVPLFLLITFNYRLSNIKNIYPFVFVVFIASLYEFIGTVLFKINVENWFLIYGTLAFFSIQYFFYDILNNRFKFLFIAFTTSYVVLLIISIYYYFSFKSSDYLVVNSFLIVFQTITILFFSILWFIKVFHEIKIDDLSQSPHFYFISGLIISYSGSVFLFLTASYIYASDKSNFQYYWLLNIILNLVLRTLLIVGIWKARVK